MAEQIDAETAAECREQAEAFLAAAHNAGLEVMALIPLSDCNECGAPTLKSRLSADGVCGSCCDLDWQREMQAEARDEA